MARNNFGSFSSGANKQQLKPQAQKLQKQMEETQEELDNKTYEASSGGGMVKVTLSGMRQILSLEINPEVIDPDDVEMLEDLIIAAVNEALKTGEETREETMGQLNPGMGGMF